MRSAGGPIPEKAVRRLLARVAIFYNGSGKHSRSVFRAVSRFRIPSFMFLEVMPSPVGPNDPTPMSPADGPEPLRREEPALPPVEPPSAGFIVQLFVVPALIVAAVIGVYLLFGKLASNEVDWRERVSDLRSSNPHTRWRGAYGLAQLLEADAARNRSREKSSAGSPTDNAPASNTEVPLARDPELASELAATLNEALARQDESDDHRRLLEYVVKALGWMEVPEIVVPALRPAYDSRQPDWLRQQALIAVGMVAGRAHEAGTPVDDPRLTQDLLDLTEGEPGLLKHLATYYLGFLDDEAAQLRLQQLLSDVDLKTRVNAAVGIARSGSLDALPVFEGLLSDAGQQAFDPKTVEDQDAANAYFERQQLAANALTFIIQSAPRLTPQQRNGLHALASPLTEVSDAKIKYLAIEAVHALEQAGRGA